MNCIKVAMNKVVSLDDCKRKTSTERDIAYRKFVLIKNNSD